MNLDYSYCEARKCTHKKVCKRYVGNYDPKEVEEAYKSNRLKRVLEDDCISGYKNQEDEFEDRYIPYHLLDRIDK